MNLPAKAFQPRFCNQQGHYLPELEKETALSVRGVALVFLHVRSYTPPGSHRGKNGTGAAWS